MNDEEFEKRYENFLRKHKSSIALKLWEEKYKSDFELGDYIKGLDLISKIQIPIFFLGGVVFSKYRDEGPVIFSLITLVVWIGLMLWIWLSYENTKDAICNYVFSHYRRNIIIENYVRYLASEYKEDTEDILDPWDVKYFYDKCIENLKYYEDIRYNNSKL